MHHAFEKVESTCLCLTWFTETKFKVNTLLGRGTFQILEPEKLIQA